MSDDGGTRIPHDVPPMPGQPSVPPQVVAPLPVGAPVAPLPLGLPGARAARRRNRRLAILIAAVAGSLALLCCCGAIIGPLLLGTAFGPDIESRLESPTVRRSLMPAEAWWVGDGAFIVVQHADAESRGVVTVLPQRGGVERDLVGYRLVAVEEADAAIWVAPDSLDATPDALGAQKPDGSRDVPSPGIRRLRLDAASTTLTLEESTDWAPWPSRHGNVARLAVRPGTGGFPSDVRFTSGGKPVKVDLPEEAAPFRPLGWSPSGRYFALLHLAEVGGDDPVVVYFVDMRDGSTAAQVADEYGELDPDEFRMGWDAKDDRIWWVHNVHDYGSEDETEPPAPVGPRVMALDRLGGMPMPGWEKWDDTDEAGIAGSGKAGPVAVSTGEQTRLWRMDGSGSRQIGTVVAGVRGAVMSVRYSDRGVLYATLEPSSQTGGFVRRLWVADRDGSHPRQVWKEAVPNPALKALGLDKLIGR
jgi:hypothetical protein